RYRSRFCNRKGSAMKRSASTLAVLTFLLSTAVMAQGPNAAKPTPTNSTSTISAAPAITATSTPLELARAALAAQGGDKFKNLKSMVLFGSVDLYGSISALLISCKFALVIAGECMWIDDDGSTMLDFKHYYYGQ